MTDTVLPQLVINELTEEQYGSITPEDKQLYLTPDTTQEDIESAINTHNSNPMSHQDIRNMIPTVDQTYSGISTNAQSGVAVKSAIDSAISSVYKPAGSVYFASLPTLSSSIEGNVYNLKDSFTTTSDFVEGAGKTYPEGTNVVCIDVSGDYKWDVLSGFVDLSGYVQTSRKINNKPLSSDITLNAGDVGALPDTTVIPTVNNATLTIQKNGTTINTFTANASSNVTANITVPSDTGDLTNGAGFITGITSSDVTTALGYTPYDDSNPNGYITGITSGDVTTALGYTPYNSSNPNGYQANVIETVKVNGTALTPSGKAVDVTVPTNNNQLTNGAGYITSSALSGYATETWVGQQGYLTSTALSGYATETWVGQQGYITGITSGDVTTALGYTPYDASNPNGYTSNVGTVTSVNNVSPVSGNVTLSIPTVNDSTITITQGGVTKGSFTLNQSSAGTIALDAGGGGSVDIDGLSITKNGDDEIQTVGVIDSNNTSNAIKTWTGTKAQYDAIVSKDANTIYNITDDTNPTQALLETMYPVGSIYIGTMSTCPLSALFGTWTLVSSGRVLQGADGNHSAGSTIEAGLPNITGDTKVAGVSKGIFDGQSGAFYLSTNDGYTISSSGTYSNAGNLGLDASRSSSIYGNNSTVQPPAYVVNIWERTA